MTAGPGSPTVDTRELELAPVRDRLLELVDEHVAERDAPSVKAFAKAYLRRITVDEDLSAEELYAEVASLFAFGAARRDEPIAARAFSPTREREGYEPSGSVIETNTHDWPFLVDSVTEELRAQGLRIARVLHPVVGVERGPDGGIARLRHPRKAAQRESFMHFELDRRLDAERLAEIEEGVRTVLAAVQDTVADFSRLTMQVARMIELARAAEGPDAEEVDETVAFLDWLLDGNFILLGFREYEIDDEEIRLVAGSGLGILRDDAASAFARPVALDSLPDSVRRRATTGDVLLVSKTNRLSPVHRRARMDYIGVRDVEDGRIVGELRLLGLFTTKAYAATAQQTPLLGRKLRRVLAAEDLIEGSHDSKAAISLFESFPKDELFTAPIEDLRRAVVSLLGLHGDDVRLLGRRGEDGRSASLIAALPAARADQATLDALEALLAERYGGASVEATPVFGEDDRVQVHYAVHSAGGLEEVALKELEREVVSRTRSWDDRLAAALAARQGPRVGAGLAGRWAPRFPEHYKAMVEPAQAVADVEGFSRLEAEETSFAVELRPEPAERGERTLLSLYKAGPKVELSQVMPVLEDLGLRVIEEVATRLGGDGERWVQEFVVLGPGDEPLALEGCAARVAEQIAAVWRGESETDSLNRLVVSAGLDWRQVTLLRAFRRYRQRIGSRFTEGYQNDVLAANPELTASLVRLFELRFDPDAGDDADARAEALREEIVAGLDEVASLDHDRILRNQLGVLDATLRTNAYAPERGAIAFKLRSAEVPAIPEPAPRYEIYVYSAAMEGIHLRGGRIARGGIRFSDRMDYRTEVFGLMRAQMTKNAVIVPEGAKGGFVLKAPPAGADALKAEIERQYVSYIRALLEVTDNLVDGEVRHPPGVRVHDDADTYLVVAADKGTATLSDTANAVAEEAGFWLGDAFASGGRTGYDHKQLGITARGAWESVKRHFSELGLDPERDAYTVAGIGDMSGDVFGNGMLLSRSLKLVAAYDHRHVFIDPDPDPAASFAERERLFALPASSWDDYDRELLSAGGGVWPRNAKSIALPPEARAALGIEQERLAPTEVIRAILRAPVDLLFNGGIGTVVKAAEESDADAQDRASDAIRVDAEDLRCRVVAEGGNLGLTRRARTAFARAGGRVNGDFIDNSAGVDCSDHEVNLKILLDLAVRRGELDRESRNELLASVTEQVSDHVLYDAFLQAQILSEEVVQAPERTDAYEELMSALEDDGLLDRASEALPSSEELAERRRDGEALERPELALLLAYAKLRVTRALLASELPDDPFLERDLRDYFPAPVVERFGHLLAEHPLRRQLVSTLEANAVVNALGPAFVSELGAECGVLDDDVVRAFRIAREVSGADARWTAIEQLPREVDRELAAELMDGVDGLVEALARWYVVHAPGSDVGEAVQASGTAFAELEAALPEIGSEEWREGRTDAAQRLVERGVPAEVAGGHVLLDELVFAPDVASVAEASGRPVAEVADTAYRLGQRLRLTWLEGELAELPADTRTRRWAARALGDDLLEVRRALVARALALGDGDGGVEALLEELDGERARLERFFRALSLDRAGGLPALTLAVRQLRALAEG